MEDPHSREHREKGEEEESIGAGGQTDGWAESRQERTKGQSGIADGPDEVEPSKAIDVAGRQVYRVAMA